MPDAPSPAVVLSPFSNERVRQWPLRCFRELIEIILREDEVRLVVVGTRDQRAVANDLVRGLSSERVGNACGTLHWAELVTAIDHAPYVIGNNSGVVHLAASRGRWTLCVFSGSHAYNEWMPRGPLVVTVVKPLACSPCGPANERCPNDLACMTRLPPSEVFWRFQQARSAFVAAGTDFPKGIDALR